MDTKINSYQIVVAKHAGKQLVSPNRRWEYGKHYNGTYAECEVDDWILFSRDRDQQRVLADMPTACWSVGATNFEACVLQCVCDVDSLSTGDINQVSVANSLTLKADYFMLELLSIRRKRHVLRRTFQRGGMVQNPLKHLMR